MNPAAPTPRVAVLDSLRAFAVAGVIAVHFPDLYIGDAVDTGTLGVRLFFVLSGCLITGLLLRDRDRIDSGKIAAGRACRDFFIRRSLRIAPAYYLALAAAWIVSIADIRSSWPWHAAYLSNEYIFRLGRWPGSLSHLWTLSLEFQFYLAWPWIALFAPRRLMPVAIGACLVAGPLSRWFAAAWGAPPDFAHLVTPGSLDFFGWGALVAWCRASGPDLAATCDRLAARWFAPLLVVSILLAGRWPWIVPMNQVHAVAGFVMGAAFAALVAVATRPAPPRWALWLGARPWLVRLGVVSYGVYLYHNLMHWVAPRVCLRLFGDSYPRTPMLYTGVLIACTLLVTALSWQFFEAPLNRLARRLTADPR